MKDSKLRKSSQIEVENKDQSMGDHHIDDQEDFHPNTTGLYENGDLYVTSFVCLLVPRFEEHSLTGDLSDHLHAWMRDICISFGWNLKFLEISPNYIHWIMTVSINSSPIEFMRAIRRITSKNIFDEFPKFSQKNVSKKFWAPHYFVGVGHVPYSKSAIQSFIEQIRMEQGLY